MRYSTEKFNTFLANRATIKARRDELPPHLAALIPPWFTQWCAERSGVDSFSGKPFFKVMNDGMAIEAFDGSMIAVTLEDDKAIFMVTIQRANHEIEQVGNRYVGAFSEGDSGVALQWRETDGDLQTDDLDVHLAKFESDVYAGHPFE